MDISMLNDLFRVNSEISSPITKSYMNFDCIINEYSEEKESLAYIKIIILTIYPWVFILSIFLIIGILVIFKKISKFMAISQLYLTFFYATISTYFSDILYSLFNFTFCR